MNYSLSALPDDPDGQVSDTIALMRGYALADSAAPSIRTEAQAAVAAEPGATPEAAVFSWVKRRVSFLADESAAGPIAGRVDAPIVEVLIRPVDLAAMCAGGGCRRAGDCDDYSMYGAALLLALGRRVSFVTVAADPVDPSRFSHVYLASYAPDGGRVPLDISHGPYAGWETPHYFRRQEWPVDNSASVLALVAAAAAAYYITRGERW